MKDLIRNPPDQPVPTVILDPRWELAQRVAASQAFARSARLRRFLLHICELSLSGREEQINEQQIGTAVFDRKPDYSPNDDNIVRVEARNLRKRLQDYFEQEGHEESIIITVPKGGYAPAFQPRSEPETAAASADKHRITPSFLHWTLTAVLLGAVVVLLGRDMRRGWMEESPIWPGLLDPANETLVVLADSNFALYQDLTRRDLRLDDYIGGKYIAAERDPALSTVASRQYTSLADATLAARIAGISSPARSAIRFARSLHVRDFHSGNAIILGSRRANPWVELFESKLNFTVVYDSAAHRIHIANQSPRAGESKQYVMESSDAKTGRSYGLISLVPNLSRSGRILILQGLNMEGTEAVGEFALTPHLMEKLRAAIGTGEGEPIPAFEVLIKLQAIGGAAKDTEIIAVRRWPM